MADPLYLHAQEYKQACDRRSDFDRRLSELVKRRDELQAKIDEMVGAVPLLDAELVTVRDRLTASIYPGITERPPAPPPEPEPAYDPSDPTPLVNVFAVAPVTE